MPEEALTLEGKLGNDCFSGDWSVAVHNVDERYVHSCSDGEAHCAPLISQQIFRKERDGDLHKPRPIVGTIQCHRYSIPQPYKMRARGEQMSATVIAGKRISGSLMPPLLRVK